MFHAQWKSIESALVACSKLGLWQDALDIYTSVESSNKSTITNYMVLALIKACVRGSKQKGKSDLTLAQRREPLDRLRDILMELEVNIVSMHFSFFSHIDLSQQTNFLYFSFIMYFAYYIIVKTLHKTRCNSYKPISSSIPITFTNRRIRISHKKHAGKSHKHARRGQKSLISIESKCQRFIFLFSLGKGACSKR